MLSKVITPLTSSIGLKVIMSITGSLLLLFVFGHMLGNLLVFFGADALNLYGHTLKSNPGLLWTARFGLLGLLALHLIVAATLTRRNRAARPEAYRFRTTIQASLASRTMIVSGALILVFIIYHLSHFTMHWVHIDQTHVDAQGRFDVYRMVIEGFSQPVVAILYLAAMGALGFHLYHGTSSLFQSLGVDHPRWTPFIQKLGPALAAVIVVGNVVIVSAVWLGLLH